MKFTPKQKQAIEEAVFSVKSRQSVYRIGGYAGSGKTTIAKEIVDKLKKPAVCAFTGKAAYNLCVRGVPATTIHSVIYQYSRKQRRFFRKDSIPFDSFVIDEASMVAEDIWRDILLFDLPIILIGDTAQLPPIGHDVYLMDNPDVLLDTIHRQRELHGILELATNIRNKEPFVKEYKNEVTFMPKNELHIPDIFHYDICLCGYNKTRHYINHAMRYYKKFTDDLYVGEKLIVLQNNPDFDVYNGEILEIVEICNNGKKSCNLRTLSNGEEKTIAMVKTHLGKTPEYDKDKEIEREFVVCDYAYAITVHKSQGAAFDKVVIIDEPMNDAIAERWRYTAVTRAARELRYYINGEPTS